MLRRLCFALLLCLCSQANALPFIQTHHERIPEFGSDATLTAPDPLLPNESFRIESGQTVAITGNESCKDIYVNGFGDDPAILELRNGCELKVQTILLAGPQAVLRSPPGQRIACRVIWRDLPFDLVNDPQQFSNGLVCVSGEVNLRGLNPRQAKAFVAAEITAGQNTITLSAAATNWKAGDQIAIPDTRQRNATSGPVRTEYRTIASVSGATVRFTQPVEFDHLACRDSGGAVVVWPEVANVTQSIVLQSENPNGVRGHSIALDHSLIDVEGVAARDMGRTTTAPLHSTIWNPTTGVVTQYGTNQIGRYAFFHFHGNPGRHDLTTPWQSRLSACSVVGSPKFGLVLHHSSHWVLAENCAIVDCAGGAYVTETPNVYGFTLADSIIIGKTPGSGLRITDRADRNLRGGDHWHGGVGLALQSAMGEFRNVSVYCMQEGIGMAGFRTTTLLKPKVRGQHTGDNYNANLTEYQNPGGATYRYPFGASSNVRIWGCWRGIETWTADCYPHTERMFLGLDLIHNRIPTDFEDHQETMIEAWRILGDFPQVVTPVTTKPPGTYGIDFKPGYRFGINVVETEIRGYDVAYDLVYDREYTSFVGCDVECPCVMYERLGYLAFEPCDVTWTDCTFTPVNGQLIGVTGWLPKYGLELWMVPNRPDRKSLDHIEIGFRPWVDGTDLDVFHHEQRASFALTPLTDETAYGDWPSGVYSNQQLIDLGTPIYGEVVPEHATQDTAHFGRFWVARPTLEQRVEELERRVDALESLN